MYAGERGYFGSVAEGVFLPSEILNRLGTGTQTRCHSGSRDQASPRAFSPDLLTGKTEERESCVPTVNNSEMAPYFALASPTSPTLALGARLLLRPSPDVSSPSCRSDISRCTLFSPHLLPGTLGSRRALGQGSLIQGGVVLLMMGCSFLISGVVRRSPDKGPEEQDTFNHPLVIACESRCTGVVGVFAR